MKICTVKDCERKHCARGYCNMHYGRWSRFGDPSIVKHFFDMDERIAAYTRAAGECIEWTGKQSTHGYGSVSVNGRWRNAHVYMWERVNGPVPASHELDHMCWNRACVNPEHLRLATREENGAHRSGPASDNRSTGVRNVYPNHDRYMVKIVKDGEVHYLGTYPTIEGAAEVAKRERDKLFGAFAGKG